MRKIHCFSAILLVFSSVSHAQQVESWVDQANVVSVSPVYQQGQQQANVCNPQMQQPAGVVSSHAGELIGAVVGGLIGAKLVSANNPQTRTGATIAGTMAGGFIGNTMQASGQSGCQVVSQPTSQLIGYDVVFQFNGHQGHVRTQQPPQNGVIPIRIAIQAQ